MSNLVHTVPTRDAASRGATITTRELSLAGVADAFIEAVTVRNSVINARIRFDADAVRRQVAELEALPRSGLSQQRAGSAPRAGRVRRAEMLLVKTGIKRTVALSGAPARHVAELQSRLPWLKQLCIHYS